MLIQVVLPAPVNNNGPLNVDYKVPFSGRCNVKFIQADTYSGIQSWYTITSNTLLNYPYLSKIVYSNTNGIQGDGRFPITSYFGDLFKIENVLINGYIDLKITVRNNTNFTSGSTYVILWLDIEYNKNKYLL